MKKRTTRYALITLLILAACSVIGGICALNLALKPDTTIREKNKTTPLYMKQNYPFLQQWTDSMKSKGALKDTFIINHENRQLHAIYAYAPKPTVNTAIIVHGYTDNAERMMMIGYLYNHDLEYNILLPDLQHHGQSEGPAIQMGWKDRFDLLRWMDEAKNIFGDSLLIVTHGISMGAATVMMASGEETPSYVRCYVEDCGYTSVWEQFTHVMRTSFGLPPFPVLYAASEVCQLRYGWNFKEASALNQVRKCRKPMLFIHGDKDNYVPTHMVYSLYEAKPCMKELWIVPGAAHAESYKLYKEEYTERIKRFVKPLMYAF